MFFCKGWILVGLPTRRSQGDSRKNPRCHLYPVNVPQELFISPVIKVCGLGTRTLWVLLVEIQRAEPLRFVPSSLMPTSRKTNPEAEQTLQVCGGEQGSHVDSGGHRMFMRIECSQAFKQFQHNHAKIP